MTLIITRTHTISVLHCNKLYKTKVPIIKFMCIYCRFKHNPFNTSCKYHVFKINRMIFTYLKSLYQAGQFFELVLVFMTGLILAFSTIFCVNFCWSLGDKRHVKKDQQKQKKEAIFKSLVQQNNMEVRQF